MRVERLSPTGGVVESLGTLWICTDCGSLVPESYLRKHNDDHAMQAALFDSLKTLWNRIPDIEGYNQITNKVTDFAPVRIKKG